MQNAKGLGSHTFFNLQLQLKLKRAKTLATLPWKQIGFCSVEHYWSLNVEQK
jgi:hypothetical protein